MTLDQLRYFIEAARYQHIGKAAKSVAISPSAVSGAIAALENELGCELFDRQGKSILLNAKGAELLRRAERLLDDSDAIQRDLAGASASLGGRCRIAGSPFLALGYLEPAWERLRLLHPNLSCEISAMATAQVIHAVAAGALDFGLCFSPLKRPGIKQLELHRGQLRIALAKNHPLIKKKPIEALKALSSLPAVVHKAVAGVDLCDMHPMFDRFGISLQIEMIFEGDDVAVRRIARSGAWSLLPEVVIRAHSDVLSILPAPPSWDAPYNISAIFPQHREQSRIVQGMLGALRL